MCTSNTHTELHWDSKLNTSTSHLRITQEEVASAHVSVYILRGKTWGSQRLPGQWIECNAGSCVQSKPHLKLQNYKSEKVTRYQKAWPCKPALSQPSSMTSTWPSHSTHSSCCRIYFDCRSLQLLWRIILLYSNYAATRKGLRSSFRHTCAGASGWGGCS